MPNTPLHRYVVKVAGESGQGVNSVGEILAKSLKETGYQVFGYREYPSLIKGGYSCYQIDVSDQPMQSSSAECDLLMCLSRVSVHAYLKTLRPGGQLVHTLKALQFSPEEEQWINERQLKIEFVDAVQIAEDQGGKWIMANTVVIGILLKMLGLSESLVVRILEAEFAHKPDMLAVNKQCLTAGLNYQPNTLVPPQLAFTKQPEIDNYYLMTGNHAIALGAISAGVRAYYAYPMTPSSSILTYLAEWQHETGMLVKQVEDEISVAQMTIGSMFMGTRALCGTAGGGFDLMTESLSMAGMTETPWVCVIGQRPGPATGLPTWTSTGDLNLAVFGGHGEYARCVVAASDLESAYRLVGEAFNIAEKYQTAVLILTEKQIAESLFLTKGFPQPAPIERHLVPDAELGQLQANQRYEITESGISKRWVPGQSPVVFDANGDEHLPDGSLTEESATSAAMYDKRMRKQATMLAELPEPQYFGPEQPEWVIVTWGSVKNAAIDALELLKTSKPELKVGVLHYEYVYPVRTEQLLKLQSQVGDNLILMENNYTGQLGGLISQATGLQFKHRLLKYDGRPFFVEDVLNYLEETC